MGRQYWRKDKPTENQVKSFIDFYSDMTNLADEAEAEESGMFQSLILDRAVFVLNDLFELQNKIMNTYKTPDGTESPNSIQNVYLRATNEKNIKISFFVCYSSDDEIHDVDWYVDNKIYVYEVLKKWVKGVQWSYEISDLEHETDFEIGDFTISFTITIRQ